MLAANLAFAGLYLLRAQLAWVTTGALAAVNLKNPFRLRSATQFGLLFAGVLLTVELARRMLPVAGLIYVAVLVCVLSNTAVQAALAAMLGSRGLGHRILLATAAMFVLGVVVMVAG